MRALILVAATLLSPSCATVCKHERLVEWNQDWYDEQLQPGTCLIRGQAFLKTRGGDVKFAAGNQVTLVPKTPYSAEWWEYAIQRGCELSPADPRAEHACRRTVADGEGRFKFEDVMPGTYYVTCPIFWEVPVNYDGLIVMEGTGALAVGQVTVTEARPADVVVTR